MSLLKRFFVLAGLFLTFNSCQNDDLGLANPFLVDIAFQFELNTNLPQYSVLNFASNAVIVPNAGLRGFVIYNIDNTQYLAYELSDPNHSPNECSRMVLSGITLSCPCATDENEYQIINGQPTQGGGRYGLKPYRATRTGNIIRVTN
jgi:hypothetical protein